jgi:hypothetical protein
VSCTLFVLSQGKRYKEEWIQFKDRRIFAGWVLKPAKQKKAALFIKK